MYLIALVLIASVLNFRTYAVPTRSEYPGEIVADIGVNSSKPLPSQLSLITNHGSVFKPLCDAVLITDSWALTLARCTSNQAFGELSLYGGILTFDSRKQIRSVEKYFIHPRYDAKRHVPNRDYDISVVKTVTPFDLSDEIRPIPLLSSVENLKYMKIATISGWGLPGTSKSMSRSSIVYLDTIRHCGTVWGRSLNPTNRIICTTRCSENKQDACPMNGVCHDRIGGPLAVNDELVGLIMMSGPCIEDGLPDTYTFVPYFRSWITSITGDLVTV